MGRCAQEKPFHHASVFFQLSSKQFGSLLALWLPWIVRGNEMEWSEYKLWECVQKVKYESVTSNVTEGDVMGATENIDEFQAQTHTALICRS